MREPGAVPDGVWTEEDHLRGRPGWAVALYRDVAEAIDGCGPVTRSVSRTTITFAGPRRGFAGARPTATGVRGYLDLTRRLGDDPRILSASPYTRRLFVHQFRLTAPQQLDDEFRAWLAEGYAVGCGEHLRG